MAQKSVHLYKIRFDEIVAYAINIMSVLVQANLTKFTIVELSKLMISSCTSTVISTFGPYGLMYFLTTPVITRLSFF